MKTTQSRVLKTFVAAAAIAVTTAVAGARMPEPTGAQGQSANTDLCHAAGNGSFALLSVNSNAVDAHLAHGDGLPFGQAPGGSSVFTSTCELVANIAGIWLGESITFDPNSDPACGQDLNEYKLTLQQSGSEVSGEVYWKILESYFPPDVGMEQTAPLTGTVSGNTFTFTYGPPEIGLVAVATFTGTTMTGTITLLGSSSCDPNTFELVRQ
jgi:hypothetical protein